MDFFREQDIARRNTRLLTLLFGVAVLVLIGMTNLLLVGFVVFESGDGHSSLSTDVLDWQSFFAVGAVITLIIGAVVLVNWINFARGGKQIAAALGGSGDALEARAELDKLVGYQAPPAAEVAADDSLRTEPN